MNQKFQDIKLLVQSDRRIWAVGGAFVVLLIIWGLTNGDKQRIQRGTGLVITNDPSNGSTEAYNDLTLAFRGDLTAISKSSEENEAVLKKLSREMAEYKERTTGIFETLVDRMEELNQEIDRLATTSPGESGVAGSIPTDEVLDSEFVQEPDEIESIGFDTTELPPPPPAEKDIRVKVISPGDLVPLKLLTGVNAPVDGTPYPVVFKLTGAINGPDGSSLDLGEARIIAAAQGSESDGRVLFRLTELSMRHQDGRRSVIPVDGWIVGEDGVRGMRGTLKDKLGRLIAMTAAVSGVSALGESLLNDANDVTNNVGSGAVQIDVSGDEFGAAGVSALTDASNRLGEILLDRYEKLVPVVEVLSGRQVMAVFSVTAEVEAYDPDDEGIYTSSLD